MSLRVTCCTEYTIFADVGLHLSSSCDDWLTSLHDGGRGMGDGQHDGHNYGGGGGDGHGLGYVNDEWDHYETAKLR